MLHDQEEQRPEQVCVLRKLLGPLAKVIPVALNKPLWIGQPGVETPDQAYGLMKIFDSQRGRSWLATCQWKIRVAFNVWRHEAHLPIRIRSDTYQYWKIQTNKYKYDKIHTNT